MSKIKDWIKKQLFPLAYCKHKWRIYRETEYVIFDEPGDKRPSEKYIEQMWQCIYCGKIEYKIVNIL